MRLFLPGVGHAFELELGAEREAIRADGASGGQLSCGKIRNVDGIERRPVLHVRNEHRAFEYVTPTEPVGLERAADIFHRLLCLALERVRQLAVRPKSYLPGKVQD